METVQKRLEAELAQLQQETRREREDTAATHDAEVRRCFLTIVLLSIEPSLLSWEDGFHSSMRSYQIGIVLAKVQLLHDKSQVLE